MVNPVFCEIVVPIGQATSFAASLRALLSETVFDREGAPRLVYRDGTMLVPFEWKH
jgi:hypothetical protein